MLEMIFILLTSTIIAAFELKCPNDLDRTFRTKHVCNNTTEVDRYSCLLDQDTNVYTESCDIRADYVRPGQKYVTHGGRKNIDCSSLKYQPFKFWSNRLSQCVFKKSMCSELGQILNRNGSSMTDNTCRCDYTAGFAFVTEPKDKCFCTPTVEDCMCYRVGCQNEMQLNQDYICSSRGDLAEFTCPTIKTTAAETKESSTINGKETPLTRNLLIKVGVTSLITLAIILLTIMTFMTETKLRQTNTLIESQKERKKNSISPEELVERLRVIIELLEHLLSNKEFDEDFQEELSAACPNYMDVLQTYKRDLLRNDCGIIIAGETSAGKTTLINHLVGTNVLFTSNIAFTQTVCRIRNSKSMSIKTYTKEECLLAEENANDLITLKSLLNKYMHFEEKTPEIVDIYLPAPILKGNVILVDSPGIGENENLDTILLDYLPQAVSFVFIVNAENTRGIHEDRFLEIFKTVIEKRKEMPCFEPEEAIFLTNKWDKIENTKEDGDTEDEHTMILNKIQSKLEEGWPSLHTDRLFKISLIQVMKSKNTPYTKQYTKFLAMLEQTIERNKNKRVEYYSRFVQNFAINAERGISSRMNLIEKSVEVREKTVLKNKEITKQLPLVAKQKMIEARHFKTEVIESLAHKLSDYLKSDKGRIAILNPLGRTNIRALPFYSFNKEIVFRINIGINRWCEGEDVLEVIKEIECEMKNLLSDIELMFHEIEEDITGFARSIHDVSFRVFTRSALHDNFMSNAMRFTDTIRVLLGKFLVRNVYCQSMRERQANAIYDEWLLSFTYEHIRDIFEENFGTEYDKVISRIFEVEIPQKLDGFTLTIDKLLNELSDSKIKKKSFTQLKKIVQDIRKNIEDFNRLMTEAYFV